MVITTRFNLGQKVWRLSLHSPTKHVQCGACEGTGEVPLANNEKWTCPSCVGRRVKRVSPPVCWNVGGPYIIGQVRVQLNIPGLNERGDERIYMFVETGIGSGTLHEEEHIFPSHEMAEKEKALRDEALIKEREGTDEARS